MLRQYQQFVGGIFRVVDAFVVGLAWWLAYWVRFHLPIIKVTKGFPAFTSYAALTPLLLLLWGAVFSTTGVYRSQRMLRRTDEVVSLVRAHLIALVLFMALTYMISDYRYSRGVLLSFGLMGAVMLVGFRLTLRNGLRWLRRRGHNLRHVVLIGASPALQVVRHQVERFPELGLRIVAQLVPDQDFKNQEELRTFLARVRPQQVMIGLEAPQSAWLEPILTSIVDETIDIRLIPDLQSFFTLGCAVDLFEGIPVLSLNESPLDGWGVIFKRLTDAILSLIGIIVISPILGLIALAVRMTSPGPILFRQERMGLDGKTFEILKFRTMPIDAEAHSGPVWARENDPRRTRLGSFLRATSLDELPQLWNIVRGEMSLVGPRPERPVFVDQFRHQIPHYMLRHKVKAGLTGWAQVNGWRGNTSLEQRIECDLYYIRNWSYLLDLKIILLTVWRGFVHKNAY